MVLPPTNLHCSQTLSFLAIPILLVLPPTNLHCSQTTQTSWFHTTRVLPPTNLHCSQTMIEMNTLLTGFCPLQICTALKPLEVSWRTPLWFCPLQICTALKRNLNNGGNAGWFCPLQICTALKPFAFSISSWSRVLPPTNLHCSQTVMYVHAPVVPVLPPTNLHCSQTGVAMER